MWFIKCNMTTWEPHLRIEISYIRPCQVSTYSTDSISTWEIHSRKDEVLNGRGSESDWFDFSSSYSYFPLCDLSSHHIKFVMKVSCSNADFINFCWYKCHSDGYFYSNFLIDRLFWIQSKLFESFVYLRTVRNHQTTPNTHIDLYENISNSLWMK
jgi:hypothetical protein